MWPRWNTRPIAVRGFPSLPTDVDPGHNVASTAPLIRAGDPVSAPTRGGSAVSDWTTAELPWGRLHAVPAGIVSPRGRPPPAQWAPPRPPSAGMLFTGAIQLRERLRCGGLVSLPQELLLTLEASAGWGCGWRSKHASGRGLGPRRPGGATLGRRETAPRAVYRVCGSPWRFGSASSRSRQGAQGRR